MQQLCDYCSKPYCSNVWLETQQTGLVYICSHPPRKVAPCRVILSEVTFKIVVRVLHFYFLQSDGPAIPAGPVELLGLSRESFLDLGQRGI